MGSTRTPRVPIHQGSAFARFSRRPAEAPAPGGASLRKRLLDNALRHSENEFLDVTPGAPSDGGGCPRRSFTLILPRSRVECAMFSKGLNLRHVTVELITRTRRSPAWPIEPRSSTGRRQARILPWSSLIQVFQAHASDSWSIYAALILPYRLRVPWRGRQDRMTSRLPGDHSSTCLIPP